MTRFLLGALLSVLSAAPALAASLDLTADVRTRARIYENPGLLLVGQSNQSFIYNRAEFGVRLKDIEVGQRRGRQMRMELGVKMTGIGVAGSTNAAAAPFSNNVSGYPGTNMEPFFENAYLKLTNLGGYRSEIWAGRQSYDFGTGLVFSDDHRGVSGLRARIPLWTSPVTLEAFFFEPRGSFTRANELNIYGGLLEIPAEGTLTLGALAERDRGPSPAAGTALARADRYFYTARYRLDMNQLSFDGEIALQRGKGTPAAAGGSEIKYKGFAYVLKGAWIQEIKGFGKGQGRASFARGSGDKNGTNGTDEAFFPSHGKRTDGFERDAFGDFFGATVYDAQGGNPTARNGLPANLSGLEITHLGATVPFKGLFFDVDFYFYQADTVLAGDRTLGHETDYRLTYKYKDDLTVTASLATFKAYAAYGLNNSARGKRVGLEFHGRF